MTDAQAVAAASKIFHGVKVSDLSRPKWTDAAMAKALMRIRDLEHRLAVLGDVPDPQENTLFALSAHHTWHHEQERLLSDRVHKLRKALHDMLQCRDVSWDADGGHDWKFALDQAIEVLEATQRSLDS